MFSTVIHTSLSMLLFERAISILHIGQICAKHGSLILTFIVSQYIPYVQALCCVSFKCASYHCRREGGKFMPMRRTPAKFPRRSGRSIIEKKHHNRQTHGLGRATFFLSAYKSRVCFVMNNRHSLLYNPVTVVESIRTAIRSSNAAECAEAFLWLQERKKGQYISVQNFLNV